MKFVGTICLVFWWGWGCARPETQTKQASLAQQIHNAAGQAQSQPDVANQEDPIDHIAPPIRTQKPAVQSNKVISQQEIDGIIKTFQKERQSGGSAGDTAWEHFLPQMLFYVQQDLSLVHLAPLIQARITIEFELDADLGKQRAGKRLQNQVAHLIGWIDRRVQDLRNQSQPANSPQAELELGWPLQRGLISSSYGYRRNPFQSEQVQFHAGIDLSAPANEPVYSAAEGVVIQTGRLGAAGKTVKIQHSQDLVSTYCHLQRISVQTGQHVEKGEQIGLVGCSGRTTGPHLHFAVSIKGESVDPLDHLEPIPLHFSDAQYAVEFGFAD